MKPHNTAMKFLALMWAVIFLVVLLSLTTTSDDTNSISETYTIINSTNLAKPGCDSRCGDLIVPYPFGIGINSNCSFGKGFDIYCNTSLNPPTASFSNESYFTIKRVSDSTLRISNLVATKCYSQNGTSPTSFRIWPDFGGWPYTISRANKFTVIGCNDHAWLSSETKTRNVSTGCMIFCSTPEQVVGAECLGSGCCQSVIPQDINYFQTQLQIWPFLYDSQKKSSFSPCTYAFVGEAKAFNFNGVDDLKDANFVKRIEESVPIVLEWAIGNVSCAEAEATHDFACQENSKCVDSTKDTGGYRCVCEQGYEGNPYLPPGCQDINECNDRELYPCFGECINTIGNYTCNCRSGYIGHAKIQDGCLSRKKSKAWVIFTSGVGLGTGILVLAIWMYKVIRKRMDEKCRKKFFKRNGGLLLQQQTLSGDDAIERTRLFSAIELEKATDQYNKNRIVGRGGQGTVYKGMLPNGKIVAVKKSKMVDERQVESFINEVFLLSQISHKNVVKLLGCCLETEVPILVYEFVSNGDLFHFIHDENYDFPSLWSMRLQIVTEVAGALAYMHYASSIPIYHRDIKSSNILLDDKFRAKLADFGISKSVLGDQTHVSTLVRGTFGYIDPQYFQSSQFTDKSDVYSFGVVLVEILTGKKPIYSIEPGESRSLATLISSTEEGNLLENIDDRVMNSPKEQLIAVAEIAKRCLHLNGTLRPTMKEVAAELEGIRSSH